MEQNQATPKRNIPRDVFLHLLAIIALYWSAVSFITLLWQTINYFFPNVLNYYPIGIIERMRFAVASLIIVFPVFILTSWYLNKIYRANSAARESKIRKWLLYFTLFIAAITVIVDLVMIVLNLLSGETTTRFILKALSVLLVAVVIFSYYLSEVRKETPSKLTKYYASASAVLVLMGIAGAFFIIGSPSSARLVQFDEQKVSDLQALQSQIVYYWQNKEKLPIVLSDLEDSISGFRAPVDPQSGAAYEYRVKDEANLLFELCATFNLESPKRAAGMRPIMSPYDKNQNWDHSAGRACFERKIDKQLYQIKKNLPAD